MLYGMFWNIIHQWCDITEDTEQKICCRQTKAQCKNIYPYIYIQWFIDNGTLNCNVLANDLNDSCYFFQLMSSTQDWWHSRMRKVESILGPIKNQMVEAWNLWMMASVWKIKIMHVKFFMLKIHWDFFS